MTSAATPLITVNCTAPGLATPAGSRPNTSHASGSATHSTASTRATERPSGAPDAGSYRPAALPISIMQAA